MAKKLAAGGGRRKLTAREHQVLTEIARGRTNKQIADILSLSEKTVTMYVSHVLRKLEVGHAPRPSLKPWPGVFWQKHRWSGRRRVDRPLADTTPVARPFLPGLAGMALVRLGKACLAGPACSAVVVTEAPNLRQGCGGGTSSGWWMLMLDACFPSSF